MKEILDRHYKRLAKDYDKYLYYSPQFVRTLTGKMIEKLDLKPEDILVDLGGGTGMYSADIHEQVKFSKPVYVVDAYQEMLDHIKDEDTMTPVHMEAVEFSKEPVQYNKVLIKEAVHHISERYELIANFYERLPAGGRLLLVHVPPEVRYPIFKKALQRAREFHAKPLELMDAIQKAGFRLDVDFIDYPHQIDRKHYFDQVKSRFMSALTSLSDAEMEQGLKEMEAEYGHLDTLEFIDHFDFITGIKEG